MSQRLAQAVLLGLILPFCQVLTAQTTVELRTDAQTDLERADAELNAAYKSIIATLTDAQKESLKLAQRAWIAYRDACAASEGAVYEGGTLAAVAQAQAAAELTSEQARLLRGLVDPAASPDASAALAAADAELNAVYAALKSIGGPDDSVKAAQRAWLQYRDSFAKASTEIRPGGQPALAEQAAKSELTALRAARLKLLFPEGYPPGGAPEARADNAMPQEPAAPSGGGGLCEAILKADMEAVRSALAKGVDLDRACDGQLDDPLHLAVGTGNTGIVGLLLDSGASLQQPDAYMGGTPLHTAAGAGDVKMVEFLLSRGADLEGTDEEGFSAVDAARAGKHEEVIRLLLARGAKPGKMAEAAAAGGEDSDTSEAMPSRPEEAPELPAAAGSADGRPAIKGFFPGMPFRDAVERMRDLELMEAAYLRPDGSINWERAIQKDARGAQFAEGTQGMMLLWKLVANPDGSLAALYWRGEVSAVLFKAKDMTTEEFLQTFMQAYGIELMDPYQAPTDLVAQALGGGTTQLGWQVVDRQHGWRLAVHEDKSLMYEAVTRAAETAFD